MAERRMFTKKITDSDVFLDMPMSTQCLYFHLNMAADDDGFINNPKKIQRMIGASDDDLKLLLAKSFIISFESGIIVIKHWKMHNYIRSDRYKPTDYTDEKSLLVMKPNKAYTLNVSEMYTKCIPNVSVGKVRLGKVRLDKDSIDNNIINNNINRGAKRTERVFKVPTVDEVRAYCIERNNTVDAESFVDFYESKGWMVGKNKMKDWKACVRTWERNRQGNNSYNSKSVEHQLSASVQAQIDALDRKDQEYDEEELDRQMKEIDEMIARGEIF